MMNKKANLLWVDLEMTGLEAGKDKILEVAVIATGWNLEPIAEYQGIAKVDEIIIKERMVGEFWDRHPEAYAGLVAQNEQGKAIEEIDEELSKFIEQNFEETVYLAGNSIHQDRRFIEQELPKLNGLLHYRMLDVSAWKIWFENAMNKKFIKPEEHRAMSDIMASINELKYYLNFIKGAKPLRKLGLKIDAEGEIK